MALCVQYNQEAPLISLDETAMGDVYSTRSISVNQDWFHWLILPEETEWPYRFDLNFNQVISCCPGERHQYINWMVNGDAIAANLINV